MMSTNPAKRRFAAAVCRDGEQGVYRFRVFYLRLNGRPSVVGGWQLYETMRRLKLLHMYRAVEKLADDASLEFDATVHGAAIAVSVAVGSWQVRLGDEPRLAARASSPR